MAYSTSKAAKLAGISPTTVRVYTADFGEFFSDQATPPKGQPRAYLDEDIGLLITIRRLKSEQKNDQAVRASLADGERDPFIPDIHQENDQARPPGAAMTKLAATVAKFEGQLTAITQERDYLRQQLENERLARIEAEKQAANLAGKLDAIQTQETAQETDTAPARPPSWWDRVRGRG